MILFTRLLLLVAIGNRAYQIAFSQMLVLLDQDKLRDDNCRYKLHGQDPAPNLQFQLRDIKANFPQVSTTEVCGKSIVDIIAATSTLRCSAPAMANASGVPRYSSTDTFDPN